MNKNSILKTFIALAIMLTAVLGTGTQAYAKRICETQYGGGETCIDEDGDLEVEKTIWNPASKNFENDIKASGGSNPYRFEKGEKITFRIVVRNTGDIRLENIELEDILPSFVKYNGGDGDGKNGNTRVEFDEFDLNPGDDKEFEFTAKVDFGGVNPKDNTICLTNIAKAEGEHEDDSNETEKDSDYANFCIKVKEGKVLGKESPKVLPKTGASEDQNKKEMANLILAGSISAGLVLVGFGLKKIADQ